MKIVQCIISTIVNYLFVHFFLQAMSAPAIENNKLEVNGPLCDLCNYLNKLYNSPERDINAKEKINIQMNALNCPEIKNYCIKYTKF